jgi:hypothetical protein
MRTWIAVGVVCLCSPAVAAKTKTPPPKATPAKTVDAAPAAPAPASAPVEAVRAPETPRAAPAERSRPGIGVNVKVGLLIPTSKLSPTAMVGLELRERLPFLKRMLGVAAEFAYFEPQLGGNGTSPSVGGAYTYTGSTRAFQLAVDALFFLPLSLPVDLYAGLGYAAFFYTTQERAFNVTTTEVQARNGLRVRAGAMWPFWGPLYASAELIYHYAQFGFAITGPVNAGAVNLNLNFGFEL